MVEENLSSEENPKEKKKNFNYLTNVLDSQCSLTAAHIKNCKFVTVYKDTQR
jgi:hypothetical protein